MSDLTEETALPEAQESGAWRVLVRSFTTLVVGETVARVFGLVAFVLLARELGPTSLGIVAVGMALVSRLSVISDSGTELLAVRDVAREPERFRELTEKILGLRLALSLAVGALFVAGVYVFTDPSTARSVEIRFALALPAMALNLRWIALGVHQERAAAAGNVSARAAFLVGVALFVLPTGSVLHVPYVYAASELVYALVVLLAVLPRHGLVLPRVDLPFWSATLRQSFPLLVSALARGIAPVELLIITAFATAREAGLYTTGAKPMYFVATLMGLFYVSFVASYSAATPPEAAVLLRRSALTSGAASIAAALAVTFIGTALLPVVFGHSYADAAAVMAILAWRLPFSALSAPLNGLLLSAGRQQLLMRNTIVSSVLTIAGDLVAMPLFGIAGVAAMSVLGGALLLALNYRSARRENLTPTVGALVAGAA